MTKEVTEQELQEKALAPRVTKDQIDSLMQRVSFVTVPQPGDTTATFVHAFLDGKFFLASGFSACVNKENFDAEIGERMATGNAIKQAENKLWELEGYRLFTNTAEQSEPTTFQDRVRLEQRELSEKLDALENMLDKGQPEFIDDENWALLQEQRKHMDAYNDTLVQRINKF